MTKDNDNLDPVGVAAIIERLREQSKAPYDGPTVPLPDAVAAVRDATQRHLPGSDLDPVGVSAAAKALNQTMELKAVERAEACVAAYLAVAGSPTAENPYPLDHPFGDAWAAGFAAGRAAATPDARLQEQLDAVDEALGPWQSAPDSDTGVVGRVQTIKNLRAAATPDQPDECDACHGTGYDLHTQTRAGCAECAGTGHYPAVSPPDPMSDGRDDALAAQAAADAWRKGYAAATPDGTLLLQLEGIAERMGRLPVQGEDAATVRRAVGVIRGGLLPSCPRGPMEATCENPGCPECALLGAATSPDERLREGLREIRDHGLTEEFPCHGFAGGADCADVMRERARAALAAADRDKSEER